MKPQIVIQEMQVGGIHNGDVGKTRARLAKQSAWKKQRVVVLIPAGATIPTKVYLSHRNIVFPPNNASAWIAALGLEVGEAYSTTIEGILAHPVLKEWEYILTIEHDNMPPADGLLRLIERMEANPRFSCIGGLYYTKGHGGQPQIWGDPKDPVLNFRPQLPVPESLVECCGTGMGFNLWRMKMFADKRLPRPLFETKTKGGVATQDLAFWMGARKLGYRCAIDCAVRVGHYELSTDTVW